MGREVCFIKLILRLFRFADVKDSKLERRNRRLYDEKEDLIALGLSEEQADKVIAGFGTMVPKSRLDDKINEVKDLTTQLKDRDTQLNDLKKLMLLGYRQKLKSCSNKTKLTRLNMKRKSKILNLKVP